jgi:CRISPR/Cas system CMR-associated protein Cmr5 small subunit
MTKKELEIEHVAFEKGMIKAWEGIMNHAESCIKAHKRDLTQKRIKQIVRMNSHLYK